MDLKEPIILNMHTSAKNPDRKNAHKGGSGPLMSKEYSYALETGQPHYVIQRFDRENQNFSTMEHSSTLCAKASKNSSKSGVYKDHNLLVSGPTNGTNTPAKSTGKTSVPMNSTKETSKQLSLEISPTTTYSPADFLASLSQLLGNGKDLKIHEAITSLISQGYSIPKNLECVFLKMSKDCFRTMMAIPSGQYSGSCMSWGMTFNGRCLTAKIGYRRPGNVQSLSAILEEHPDRKYFLSAKAKKYLLRAYDRDRLRINIRQQSPQTTEKESTQVERP